MIKGFVQKIKMIKGEPNLFKRHCCKIKLSRVSYIIGSCIYHPNLLFFVATWMWKIGNQRHTDTHFLSSKIKSKKIIILQPIKDYFNFSHELRALKMGMESQCIILICFYPTTSKNNTKEMNQINIKWKWEHNEKSLNLRKPT